MPDHPIDNNLGDTENNFIQVAAARPCWHCGVSTRWISINFEAPLHPWVCAVAKEEEFVQAMRGNDNND